jgi:predicted nucleic acid-binding protein
VQTGKKVVPSLDVLGRISAFVLNRSTDNFRSELYEHLIMMTLHEDQEDKGTTIDMIRFSMEKDLKVEKLPASLIEHALHSLIEKGTVKHVKGKAGELFFLAQDERTRINIMKEQYFQTTNQVKKTISEKIKERGISLDIVSEPIVFTTFRNFLATTLSRLGTECCYGLIGSKGKETHSLQPTNVSDILDQILETVQDELLHEAERSVFIEYISRPDEALSDFLYSLAQSYFFIQVLRIDPECQALTKASLQNKKVYLDTNVIHHALTGVSTRYKSADDALKLTSALGVTTVLSDLTKEEFLFLLEKRKREFGRDPKVPKKRFEKMSLSLEDGFLKDFLKKKSDNPNLTFDRYADRYEELETVLRNRYQTLFDERDHEQIFDNPEMKELTKIVTEEGIKFGLFKTDDVAKHDAFHILLIQDMRSKDKGDILGPNYWFLTHDRSLRAVEEKFDKYEKFPSSIFLDNWLQLLSPLLAPEQTKNARDAYLGLFASRLPLLSRVVDEEIFLAFQGKWMDDEDLSPDDVARIIGNRYVKDYYDKVSSAEKPISSEDKENIIESIVAEVKTQHQETTLIQQELSTLRVTTQELQKQVNSWRTKAAKQTGILRRLGHVIGAVIFFALWYSLYIYFRVYQSVNHPEAFISAMILAAILGTLADLYGYKQLLDKLLRSKSSNGESKD